MPRPGGFIVGKRLSQVRNGYWYFTSGLHEELINDLVCPSAADLEKREHKLREKVEPAAVLAASNPTAKSQPSEQGSLPA